VSYAAAVRGTADLHLLATPLPRLLQEVTGLEPEPSDVHTMIDRGAGVRSTQRLALADLGGGVVAFTWPAELKSQADYLYDGERGPRLLEAARAGGWEIDTRPHLGFWNSAAPQRLYMNPTIGVDEYVARWAGPDGRQIGQHQPDTIRPRLWPWLLERGFASPSDEPELDPFIRRLGKRAAHVRPALRLLRRWSPEEAAALRARDELAGEIRSEVNRLLLAVGDRTLPARS
jgi:hypothetical protein